MPRLFIILALFCFAWTLPAFAEPVDYSAAVLGHLRRVTEQVDRMVRLSSERHATHGELHEIRNLRVSWEAYVQAEQQALKFNASYHITMTRACYRSEDHLPISFPRILTRWRRNFTKPIELVVS